MRRVLNTMRWGGLAVLLIVVTVGCEEDVKPEGKADKKSPQVKKTPTAKPGDKTAPAKTGNTKKRVSEKSPQAKKTLATAPTPAPVKPATAKKAKTPRRPVPKPVTASPELAQASPAPRPIAAKPTPKPVKTSPTPMPPAPPLEIRKLSDQQIALYNNLQQKNLQLLLDLRSAEEHNLKLRRALLESRKLGSKFRAKENQNNVTIEMQKREICELNKKLKHGGRAVGDKASLVSRKKAELESSKAIAELKRLKDAHEKLQIRYKLARMSDPARKVRKLLVEVQNLNAKIQSLEATHRKLAHTVVTQSDKNRALQERYAGLIHEFTELKKTLQKAIQQVRLARKETARQQNAAAAATRQAKRLARQLAQAKRAAAIAAKTRPAPPKATPAKPAAKPKRIAARTKPKTAPAKPAKPAKRTRKPAAPIDGTHLAGKITAIKDMVVLVNLGKQHGLEKGMRLIVYRDDQFVGYLRVEEIGKAEAAGVLTRKILDPKVGDNVIDRLE
ncbi:MAG: hypothetical protein K8S55_09235 [Phycisphaerae bacterium]|nr:hypothetical protein [Phycisphaerae bacterium]